MILTATLTFVASYFEMNALFSISQLMTVIKFWLILLLTAWCIYTSIKIDKIILGDEDNKENGKCLFIMP